jgi:hypothetical protein
VFGLFVQIGSGFPVVKMQLAVWAYAQLAGKTEEHINRGDS